MVGTALRLLRIDAGLSLRALAQRVGVSSAYLSRVENGHDPAPTPERLIAMAEALDVPPNMLVELAQQTGSALSSYLERVPAASSFFLEVARRDLDSAQLSRLREFMDTELAPTDRARPAASASLDDLIAGRIVLDLSCQDIDAAIAAGAVELAGPGPRAGAIAQRIREREALSPTALGRGVAVPHAVVEGAQTSAALIKLAQPLAAETPDERPIEVVVVLISGAAGAEHLEALARIARLARHDVARQLRLIDSPVRAAALIARIDATL